jgi:hypothetical protein
MIRLNPNDNQGVRDQLLLYLIRINDYNKFITYDKLYKDDLGAFSSYNRALFAFKTLGSSSRSNEILQKAAASNNYVIPRLLMKTISDDFPEVYGMGDENEATYYCFFAHQIWHETKGAIDWIRKNSKASGLKIVK